MEKVIDYMALIDEVEKNKTEEEWSARLPEPAADREVDYQIVIDAWEEERARMGFEKES